MAVDQIKNGAVTTANYGTQAYKIYQKGMKLVGPMECPWCYKNIPRDQLDAHLLLHKNGHDVCEVRRAYAEGTRAGKEAAKAYKKQEKAYKKQGKETREQAKRALQQPRTTTIRYRE